MRLRSGQSGQAGGLWFYAEDGTRCIAASRTRAGWQVTCEVHGEIAVPPSPASDLAVAAAISHVAHEHGGMKESKRAGRGRK